MSGKTTVFTWDEVSLEVNEWVVDAPPDGLPPRRALAVLDDEVSEEIGDADEMGTYGRKVRQEGDVLVLDARFGRDKVTSLYWCKEDPAKARAQAEADAARFLDQD